MTAISPRLAPGTRPSESGIGLDQLVSLAVTHSRAHLRARAQHLHVEALAAPIVVQGNVPRLARALGQLLRTASQCAAEHGEIQLLIAQIGAYATLKVRVDAATAQAAACRVARRSSAWNHARRAVSAHGGQLTVREDPDGCLEYLMALPACDRSRPDMGRRREPWIGGSDVPVRRVLVVDDSPDAADAMACLLSIRGHEVLVAYDGITALGKALTWGPEIALLDIQMPGMDGIEVAHALKAEGFGEGLVCIALSGYAAPFETEATAPFDLHLSKPVDPAVLTEAVEVFAPARAVAARERMPLLAGALPRPRRRSRIAARGKL
jgi:two-component system CheB/CheR fusion protein